MPNGTYGGVRGRKTKVGRKLSFSSYSIFKRTHLVGIVFAVSSISFKFRIFQYVMNYKSVR